MIVNAVNGGEERRPVIVEDVTLAYAEERGKDRIKSLGRPAIDDANGLRRRFESDFDFVHAIEVIAEGIVHGAGVLNFGEVIDSEFERCRDFVLEVPDGIEVVRVDARKLGVGVPALDPAVSMLLLDVEAFSAGVHAGRAGAFTAAVAIELPAVVFALDAVADDFAVAELEASMRADVVDGGGSSVASAVEADETVGELDADGLVAECLAGEHGMPMIEDRHVRLRARDFFSSANYPTGIE